MCVCVWFFFLALLNFPPPLSLFLNKLLSSSLFLGHLLCMHSLSVHAVILSLFLSRTLSLSFFPTLSVALRPPTSDATVGGGKSAMRQRNKLQYCAPVQITIKYDWINSYSELPDLPVVYQMMLCLWGDGISQSLFKGKE